MTTCSQVSVHGLATVQSHYDQLLQFTLCLLWFYYNVQSQKCQNAKFLKIQKLHACTALYLRQWQMAFQQGLGATEKRTFSVNGVLTSKIEFGSTPKWQKSAYPSWENQLEGRNFELTEIDQPASSTGKRLQLRMSVTLHLVDECIK